jgi:hypothetical protein
MTNTGDHGSAAILGKMCENIDYKDINNNTISMTICAKNIINVIDQNGQFDIIGFQEASNLLKLWKYSKILQNMNYVHNQGHKRAELITFYNPTRFELKAVKVGDLGYTKNDGRPYQILFLHDIIINKNIICINLHNPHEINKNDLTTKLSKNINMAVTNENTNEKENISPQITNTERYRETDITTILSEYNYIIFLGDTNDHNLEDFWRGFKPFKPFKGVDNLNTISVSSKQNKPPFTCCSVPTTTHTFYGDYILISDNMEYKLNNTILENVPYLTSDHKPVRAIVKYKTSNNFKKLEISELKYINCINNYYRYYKKLKNINIHEYTLFQNKSMVPKNIMSNLFNDIISIIWNIDKVKIFGFVRIGKEPENDWLWIVFNNKNSLYIEIEKTPGGTDQQNLLVSDKGLSVKFKNNHNEIIKENIYLFLFLLGFQLDTKYGEILLVDAFINEIKI